MVTGAKIFLKVHVKSYEYMRYIVLTYIYKKKENKILSIKGIRSLSTVEGRDNLSMTVFRKCFELKQNRIWKIHWNEWPEGIT